MRNTVVLTGMMGSGKTTLGKLLSEKLGYSFIDLDHFIENIESSQVARNFKHPEECH